MITKDNYSLYADLYAKINKALGLDNTTDEKAPINDIGDYFLLLEDIKKAAYSGDEGTDPSFLILPGDEGIFEINANTRTISVPSDFTKNGVGVKGDELAEIVYFSIDRYFDLMDLFKKEILIQWELPNGEQGYSAVINKTRNYIKNKVVFGWPITSELTEQAGNIKFSVRFYDIGTKPDGKTEYLSYSFGTLAATVKINAGLDFNFNSSEILTKEIIDKKQQILDNLKNSDSDNVGDKAAEPVFVDLKPNDKEEYNLKDLDNGHLEGRAKFDTSIKDRAMGSISYSWEYVDFKDSQLTEYSKYADWNDYSIEYRAIDKNNETKDLGDAYWIENSSVSGQYEPYTKDWKNDDTNPTVYKLFSLCTPAKAGAYRLKAHNYAGRGNAIDSYSKPWVIAYAKPANIDLTGNTNLKLENGEAVIDLSAKIVATDDSDLSCIWYKDNEIVANENENDKIFKATVAGEYQVKVTSEKNADSAVIMSDKITVTHAPEEPQITCKVNGVATTKLDTLYGVETIEVEVTYPNNYSEKTTYQWYKKTGENTGEIVKNEESNIFKPTEIGKYYVVVTNEYNTFIAEPKPSNVFDVSSLRPAEE